MEHAETESLRVPCAISGRQHEEESVESIVSVALKAAVPVTGSVFVCARGCVSPCDGLCACDGFCVCDGLGVCRCMGGCDGACGYDGVCVWESLWG